MNDDGIVGADRAARARRRDHSAGRGRFAGLARRLAPMLALLLFAACGGSSDDEAAGEVSPDARTQEEIRQRLEAYLPVLATSYASGDIEQLRPFVVERVMAQVEKRVSDLAAAGMVLEPELRGLVLEKVVGWGNDFAIVTTLETWDLRYLSGAGSPVSERLGTRNRVEYQLKKIDGEWMVFHRALEQEFEEGP